MMGLKKIFLSLLCSVLLAGWASAQDTTDTSQGSYFLSFVKKVYFNPTILLATQDFHEQHNVRVLILPDLNGAEENQITGFERGMQKIIRFLIEGDDEGSIRFYFDAEDTESPFSFVYAEELHCKFTTADKDSIVYLLNAPFQNATFNLNSHALFEASIEGALAYAGKCLQHVTAQCGEMPEHATTEINTKPLAISVHTTSGTHYDIDHKQHDLLESHYPKARDVFTDQDWYAPAKFMVAGESPEPIAIAIDKHETLFKKQNLVFRTVYNNQVIPIEPSSTNDTIKLVLPDDLPSGNPIEVVVKYTSTIDSIQYTVGFFMVYVYEPKEVKLNILTANGYTLGTTEQTVIENQLKAVYDPVGVHFVVEKKEWMPDSEWSNNITIESSGLLSNYPPDLRDWVNGVQDLNDYDEDEYYLVFGLTTTELAGYMPRARNIGFVFAGATVPGKTAAHELGHGVYHLRHIFAEEELGLEAFKNTENVMDYADNPNDLHALYLHQWKFIDDPASVSWFGGDDEDAASGHVERGIPNVWWKNDYVGFITPGHSKIVFDRNLKDAFFTMHPNDFLEDVDHMNLQGSLYSFSYTKKLAPTEGGRTEELNPTNYTAKFDGGNFLGYFDDYENPFDQYSVATNADSVIVGLLNYNTANFFRAKVDFPSYLPQSRTMYSLVNDLNEIESKVKIADKNLTAHALSSSAFFDLSSNNYYSEDALKVLLYAQKTYAGMSVAWKIAGLRSLYPEIYDKMTVYGFNVLQHNVVDNDFRVTLCQFGDAVVSASNWFSLGGSGDEYTSCGYYDYKYADNNYETLSELEQNRLFLFHFQELINAYKQTYQPVINNILQNCTSSPFMTGSTLYNAEIIKNAVMGMSTTEIATICPAVKTKLIAIILDPSFLANLGVVSESYERSILKLILNTAPDDEYSLLKKLCTEKFGDTGDQEIIIKTIADAVDDQTCWIGKDNYTAIMNWIIKVYNKHPVASDNKLSNVTLENLDYAKYLYLQKHVVTYNYQGFCERLFKSVIPGLATISFDMKEADLETEVTIYNTKVVYVNHSILGFSSYNQTEPMYLDPLEAIVLDDKSKLLDIYGSDSELGGYIVPAIILYFAERKADSRTTTEVIQTIVDVATFFIPGGQVTGLMKILNYADKLSSVASIASNYFSDDSPETSAALGYVSMILGLADASSGALKHTDLSGPEALFAKLSRSRSVYNTSEHVQRVTKACDDFINNANPNVLMLKNDPEAKAFMKQLFEGELQAAKKAEDWTVYNKVKKAINSLDNLNVPIPDVDLYNKLADFNDYWSNNALFAKKADNTSIKIAHVDAEKRLIFDHFDDATEVSPSAKLSSTVEDQVWYEFKNNKYVQKKEDMLFFDDNGVIKCLHGKNCFTAGTLVASNRGQVAIEQLHEGDSVKSYNEGTGLFEWKKVTKTFKSYTARILRLVVGTDTVWSTNEHPFYVNGSWLKANLLTIGMQVLTPVGYSEVVCVAEEDSLVTTYNLTVEGNHNYLIGNQGLLVHNGCGEVGEMLERLGDDKPAFWADFKDNSTLLDKFGDGVYSEKAWQKLKEFENFRKETSYLRMATDLLPLKVKYKLTNNLFQILSENNTVLAELVSDGAGGKFFKILQKVEDVPSPNQKSLADFVCKDENGNVLSGGFVKRADGSVKFVTGAGDLFRGVTKSEFIGTVGDFANGAKAQIADQAWDLWKQQKWSDLENLFNANNINKYNNVVFPPNNGAINIVKKTLDPSDFSGNLIIDRYGATTGKFTAPANTPFGQRALPSSYASQTPQKYKVLKPIPNVEEGQIIPWFNQPGLGIQYKLEKSVQYYIDEGFLQIIP